jgi:predicted nucleic acid-binding protein
MTERPFVDTNILIYAHDCDAGSRHDQANAIVRGLWEQGGGILSTQVLQEFYVNVTRKMAKPLDPATARGLISAYREWRVEVVEVSTILQASEYQERYRIAFWDAVIIAAAVQGGASILLTEDLNHGQVIAGVEVRNPFKG